LPRSVETLAPLDFLLAFPMSWVVFATVLLATIAATAVVTFLFRAIPVIRSLVMALFSAPKPAARVETALGEFVRGRDYWDGNVLVPHGEIHILATDVDDGPNPSFLDKLPEILSRLPLLEGIARGQVDSLTNKHALDQVVDDASTDLVLGFSREEDAWGETVYVSFKGNEVVKWDTVE
jgi:hypothetical protein